MPSVPRCSEGGSRPQFLPRTAIRQLLSRRNDTGYGEQRSQSVILDAGCREEGGRGWDLQRLQQLAPAGVCSWPLQPAAAATGAAAAAARHPAAVSTSCSTAAFIIQRGGAAGCINNAQGGSGTDGGARAPHMTSCFSDRQ